jgi:hypothetical protein
MNTRTFAIAALSVSLLTALPGCQSAAGLLGQTDTMSLLAPAIRSAANGYVKNLNELTKLVTSVKDVPTALDAASKFNKAYQPLKENYETIASLSPQEKDLVWKAFGSQFNKSNTSFLSQASRVKGMSDSSKFLAPLLDNVSLLKK